MNLYFDKAFWHPFWNALGGGPSSQHSNSSKDCSLFKVEPLPVLGVKVE